MGGLDKGLQLLREIPLASHALNRLRSQKPYAPDMLAINANRNLEQYAALGVAVWPDAMPHDVPTFAGPLAGILSALEQCQGLYDYLLTVPCDAPLLPLDLMTRLLAQLSASHADLAMACAPDAESGDLQTLRAQPVFCLINTRLAASLKYYLANGGRKVGDWCAQQKMVRVAFNQPADDPYAFANANTPDDLLRLSARE